MSAVKIRPETRIIASPVQVSTIASDPRHPVQPVATIATNAPMVNSHIRVVVMK